MHAMNPRDREDMILARRRGSLTLDTAPLTPAKLAAKEWGEVIEDDDQVVDVEPARPPLSRLNG